MKIQNPTTRYVGSNIVRMASVFFALFANAQALAESKITILDFE